MTDLPSMPPPSSGQLNILVLVARDPAHPAAAGGDNHAMVLSRELVQAGHRVTVWTASGEGLSREEVRRGVRIVRLAPPRLLAPPVWARLLFGRARAYDVVLEEVIGGERTPFFAGILARKRSVGFWYQDNRTLFEAMYGRLGRVLGSAVQSGLLRVYRARPLITNSVTSRDWLVGPGGHTGPVAVHTPTVSFPREEVLVPFDRRPNRFVSIGKFRRLKRFEEAIEVLGLLLGEVPDAELVLLGREDDAGYLAELRQLARARGLAERVRFVMNALDAEKFSILSTAKALTIHSPVEGFGWTVPEAGLCGVPVVANVGTPADVVEEGLNGVRLPHGAAVEYARVLGRWMRDPVEWGRLSEGAQRAALRHTRTTAPPEVLGLVAAAAGPTGGPTRRSVSTA